MTEPVVTEQEIDEYLDSPIPCLWAWHNFLGARRNARLAKVLLSGEEVHIRIATDLPPRDGQVVTVPEIGAEPDEPKPTREEWRAYIRGVIYNGKVERLEEEDAERREKDGREALRQTRDLLGRTT